MGEAALSRRDPGARVDKTFRNTGTGAKAVGISVVVLAKAGV